MSTPNPTTAHLEPFRVATAAQWTVRPVEAKDINRVRDLVRRAGLPVEGIEDQFRAGYAVAEVNGEVIGTVGLEVHGNYGLLRSLAVEESWRDQRVGVSLVNDRLDWAMFRGLNSVYLLTETAPDYFAKFTFQRVSRGTAPQVLQTSREFAELCPESATVMKMSMEQWGAGLREEVREKYGALARGIKQKSKTEGDDCCGSDCCGDASLEPDYKTAVTSNLYEDEEVRNVSDAARASLGCGNPTALIELHEGETVLDLGSGGGLDVILSAKRVAPTGKAYGLDMTDDMLELAEENRRKAGVENVEFIKGEIENIPLPDNSVDVVISNCVINLSTNKPRVLAEAFRVLKPGGRFAVADIVATEPVPAPIRRSIELWAGCIGGSMEVKEYRHYLEHAGFAEIDVQPTRIYTADDITGADCSCGASKEKIGGDIDSDAIDGKFMSAFVRATKPSV